MFAPLKSIDGRNMPYSNYQTGKQQSKQQRYQPKTIFQRQGLHFHDAPPFCSQTGECSKTTNAMTTPNSKHPMAESLRAVHDKRNTVYRFHSIDSDKYQT
jgi:hypothetical protein